MSIRIVDNRRETVASVLLDTLPQAREALLAVAFVKTTGLRLIDKALEKCLAQGARVEFIVGLDFHLTDAQVLRRLCEMKANGVSLFCYGDPARAAPRLFHPKLYLLGHEGTVTAIVGSSNLTEGGLAKNVEVNVVIEDSAKAELFSDLYGVYNSFKFQADRIEPDSEYIRLYAQTAARLRSREAAAVTDRQTKTLVRELKEKARTLPHPKVSPTDLKGWQKLVYARLPHGQFRTSDMYKFQEEFARAYPENKHITDKIRQILQQLRDLGLLRHLGKETWEF